MAAAHWVLSMPPDGRFTRTLVVMRRDDTGTEGLRGIRYQRIGDGAFVRSRGGRAGRAAGMARNLAIQDAVAAAGALPQAGRA